MRRLFALFAVGLLLEFAQADDAPQLTNRPETAGPYVTADSFEFWCTFDIASTDARQNFEVSWTFNNQSDPKIAKQTLTGAQRVATLQGRLLRSHIDKYVQCTIRTFYTATPRVKYVYYGSINFLGVRAVSAPAIHLQGTNSFTFKSEIGAGTDDANLNIEHIWTFNGAQDSNIRPSTITGQQRTATLAGTALVGHFNSQIVSKARLVFSKLNLSTAFVTSRPFFAGIKTSSNKIKISACDKEKTVDVTSTIPVVCDSGDNCCLNFKISLDKNSLVSLKDTCSPRICQSDWNPNTNEASARITVVPKRTTANFSAKKVNLRFDQAEVSSSGLYSNALGGMKPDAIEIDPEPEPSETCSVTGDPHFKESLTKKVFDLYQAGDYTVYLVKERDFIVQIRTWKCGKVACICGVAVKEKNNIIRVNGCDKPGKAHTASLDIAYPLSSGNEVQRSKDGRRVGILFASGSSIKITLREKAYDLFIDTPGCDKATRTGACGRPIPGKEFSHPDGTVTPFCTGRGRCIPVTFTESWRVSGNASMFVVVPNRVEEEEQQQYCSCSLDSQRKPVIQCSQREHIQDNPVVCPKCQTASPTPTPWGQPGHEEKPYEHKPIPPADPNQNWPNAEGTTEAQANDQCLNAIRKSSVYTNCQNMKTLTETTLDQCKGDILNGGTSEFVKDATETFTSSCQVEISKNESNYVPDKDGKPGLKPDFVEICSPECEDHGQCDNGGECVCQSGWAGENCQIDVEKGPQIDRTDGSVCHDSKKACDSVQFDTDNVEIFEKLKCKVQAVDEKGKKIGQPITTNIAPVSSPSVTCPLPVTDDARQKFVVSVCTENGKCGNEVTITVYDPACLQCDNTRCQIKPSTCNINNKCYKDGETNPQNKNQVCDSANQTPQSDGTNTESTQAGDCPDSHKLQEVKNLVKQLCKLLSVDEL